MKAKSLQFGKAMSAALFVLLLSVAGMKNAFAQTQVASLQHNDTIAGVYYGANAFVSAYNAAVNGDVITLSSGTFTPTNITKAITLRGSGSAIDTIAHTYPTYISGSFIIDISNSTHALIVEGISFSTSTITYYNITNPRFIKCEFNQFSSRTGDPYHTPNGVIQNGLFIDCNIKEITFSRYVTNTKIINSVIWNLWSPINMAEFVIRNSFFRVNGNYSNMTAFNSILVSTNPNDQLDASCGLYNCIGIKNGFSSPFAQNNNNTNLIVDTYSDVFETFDGSAFSFNEQYILKEVIANGFLGGDGTQVGIHGGVMPYNPRPTHMVVKHCNVANKSTVDGKLSVEIEVYTEDE